MFQFDPMYQPYASNRFCVTARNGMVATGSNLAGAAGLEMLKKGGNAVDAPRNISLGAVQAQHPDGRMPRLGWTPVMVPGAVKAWPTLLKRFGKLTLKEVLEPAIRYAEEGWPVSPNIALLWERAAAQYGRLLRGQAAYREWFRVFTKDGEPYRFGPKDVVISNIRMGFGHYRISMAMASAAKALGYNPLWFDLHSFKDTTCGKVIRHQNDLYSLGSRLSQKSKLFNIFWE